MFRLLLVTTMLLSTSACGGGAPTVISDTPKYNYGDYYKQRRAPQPAPRKSYPKMDQTQRPALQKPEGPNGGREWDITDDRFITTHPLDMSAEVLGVSKDEIRNRLKEIENRQ
jgi:hypothetical protein